MNVDQYQILAARTINPEMTKEQTEDMAMLGMIGELGELTEIFKKQIFHGKEPAPGHALEEAGDFLWYLTLAATTKDARLSIWAGLPDFGDFDAAALDSIEKAITANPGTEPAVLTRQPPFFFQLAKAVVGGLTVAQTLTILAVLAHPFGGLDAAARANIRKLEARHSLPEGNLDAIPFKPAAPEKIPFEGSGLEVIEKVIAEITTPEGNG